MTPQETYVNNLHINNVALYGETAARFIRYTAIAYARVRIIIAGCEMSFKGMQAAKQAGDLAADGSTHLANLLQIPEDAVLSYLELGKKMAIDSEAFVQEHSDDKIS